MCEVAATRRAELVRPVKLYGSWRCPYVQRAWIGLEEKAVDYQWVDVPSVAATSSSAVAAQDSASGAVEGYESQALPPAAVLHAAPKAPALQNGEERVGEDSLVLLEYIHEAFLGPPLLPITPYLRAQVRLWTRHVDSHIVPHYDGLLVAATPEARAQAHAALLRGLGEFEQAMAPEAEGPFFLGDDFTMADIALAPWWQRMCSVLRAFRKFDPSACPRLQTWSEAVEARVSFHRTAADPERLIEEFSVTAPRSPISPLAAGAAAAAPRSARASLGSAASGEGGSGGGEAGGSCADGGARFGRRRSGDVVEDGATFQRRSSFKMRAAAA